MLQVLLPSLRGGLLVSMTLATSPNDFTMTSGRQEASLTPVTPSALTVTVRGSTGVAEHL